MKLLYKLILLTVFTITYVSFSCSDSFGQAPQILTMKLENTFTDPAINNIFHSNIRIRVKVDLPVSTTTGILYYVIYNKAPLSAPTAQEIESYVTGSQMPTGGVAKKSLVVSDLNQQTVLVTLSGSMTYYTYAVCKGSNGSYSNVNSSTIRLFTGKKSATYNYVEYLPSTYSTNSKYPVLIFLHGAGEVNWNLETKRLDTVLTHGPGNIIAQGKVLKSFFDSLIVICPQAPVNIWDPRVLDAFIEDVKMKYNVDLTRIYLTGLSLGGIGTWNYALRHPDKLAAIVPISGRGDRYMACNISKLPIWAFHDDPDGTVTTTGTTFMESDINACPNKVTPRVTLYNYPSNTHSAWRIAYGYNAKTTIPGMTGITNRPAIDPSLPPGVEYNNIYDWLQTKKRTATGPLVNILIADKLEVNPKDTLKLTALTTAPGVSYSWETVSRYPNAPAPILKGKETPNVSISGFIKSIRYIFRVTITDGNGYKDTDEIIITTINQPPLADAGLDKIITTTSVVLSGSGSDPDGYSPASYRWYIISKPATYNISGNWVNDRTSTVTVNNMVPGEYKFRLTVTDILDITGSDEVTVTVTNNTPPSVKAGLDQTITIPTVSTLSITGTASDPDGITSYLWTKQSGPSVIMSGINTPNLNLNNFTSAGIYTFRLTATDSRSASAFDEVTVVVSRRIEAEAQGNTITGYIINVNKHSGGKSVMISIPDSLTFASFSIPPGAFKIRAWVRTGSFNADTSYDNPTSYSTNYRFILNGNAFPLTLDENNIYTKEEFYGRSYWGLMNSAIITLNSLSTLKVKATNNYSGIDYIELIPVVTTSGSGNSRVFSDKILLPTGSERLYPNPVHDKLTVFLPGEINKAKITITDLSGTVCYSSDVQIEAGKVELDVLNLSPGVFILKMNAPAYITTVRFVKQ